MSLYSTWSLVAVIPQRRCEAWSFAIGVGTLWRADLLSSTKVRSVELRNSHSLNI